MVDYGRVFGGFSRFRSAGVSDREHAGQIAVRDRRMIVHPRDLVIRMASCSESAEKSPKPPVFLPTFSDSISTG